VVLLLWVSVVLHVVGVAVDVDIYAGTVVRMCCMCVSLVLVLSLCVVWLLMLALPAIDVVVDVVVVAGCGVECRVVM